MSESSLNKTVIILAGPTAVGKTAVAVEIAKHFGTSIISADSRQCYRELNIGVARPSEQQLQKVPHFFIGTHSIIEEVNAVTFEQYAVEKINQIHRHHPIAVMAGGTGLYLRTFMEGIDEIPAVPIKTRSAIYNQYKQHGLKWLQQKVKEKDPVFFEKGEVHNPQRLLRALEVVETTGQSIISFQKGIKVKRDFRLIKVGLEISKDQLYTNINQRTEEMIKNGLVEEARSLQQYRHINALKTVGYTEIFQYLDQKISLKAAIEQINIHTRQYAKRQLTWFKKDLEYKWFHPSDLSEIASFCNTNS